MKIALYVPCFNAEKTLPDCLEGIFNQSRPADDVFIIDDGSSDRTVELAGKYPVRVIRHAVNLGLAAARNSALRNTDADLVASLDSDCKPGRDWLKHLSEKMVSSNIAGAGGKTIEVGTSGLIDRWRAVHMRQHWGNRKKNNPDFLFGSNTLFHRKLLLGIGSYNEKYGNNFEDVDISVRLKEKGYSLVYEPLAVVEHLRKDDVSSLLNNFWKWNLPYYAKKGFYNNVERFAFKVKDNIGLSNRFIEEDLKNNRRDLIYLDFLIALHHSLRDFDYFNFQGKPGEFGIAAHSRMSFWLSLLDITFFYHFDRSKKELNTFLPKENYFQQNFIALSLTLSALMKMRFKSGKFDRVLYKHLLFSVHKIDDEKLLDKLVSLTELHHDWSGLLSKKQENINRKFLKVLSSGFKNWIDVLIYRFPRIAGSIKRSAEILETEIAAA